MKDAVDKLSKSIKDLKNGGTVSDVSTALTNVSTASDSVEVIAGISFE